MFIHGIVGILCLILWIWALVDCLHNSGLQGTEKLIWVLVIIFLPFLGSILYLLIGRNKPV
jgi:Phospholipase_D-nuclease N-terminal